ncbi:MAG: DUF5623 domain-containing protein [Achromobacter sp.]|nr:DUF5623 domain-containing protein [Achromobacter sp.]
MNTASIKPVSVNGIKQLAKKISREQNITHTDALNLASRQAGYENFVHAKRQLPVASAPRGFPVYISVHWFTRRPRKDDQTPNGLRHGRELLCVHLSRPLPEIVAKHRVGHARGLYGFRMEYVDHLEHRTNVDNQEAARDLLLKAERSLRFMEATGLQPVSTKKFDAIASVLNGMPGRDHNSDWFDPVSGSYVCLDEPYAAEVKRMEAKRAHWLQSNGFKMVVPKWEGIYYAGECIPLLIGLDGALLQRVADALANLRPVVEPHPWPHETGRCNDDFVSPQREADAKPRRRRPGPSYGEYNGAVPYGGQTGIPSRWRPAKAMAIELHLQLAPLMRGLSAIGFSSRVHSKLGAARSELDNWWPLEHRDEQGRALDDIYYGGPIAVCGDSDMERLAMLTEARSIVVRGYDDCKPRRTLLAAFDAGIAELQKVERNRAAASSGASAAN